MFPIHSALTLKNRLKKDLAENRVDRVFDRLKRLFKREKDHQGALINLESQWASAKTLRGQGMASYEEIDRTENRIRTTLLDYIEKINDSMLWELRRYGLVWPVIAATILVFGIWALKPAPPPKCVPDLQTRNLVQQNDKTGYQDNCGDFVISPVYQNGNPFSEGFAAVAKDDYWGFIDKQGAVQIPFRYENAESFSEGLAAVKKGGLWGFVDYNGQEIIPCRFENILAFSEGLAAVKVLRKWGYVDKKGELVIPCRYTTAERFDGGQALVTLHDSTPVRINRTGELIE